MDDPARAEAQHLDAKLEFFYTERGRNDSTGPRWGLDLGGTMMRNSMIPVPRPSIAFVLFSVLGVFTAGGIASAARAPEEKPNATQLIELAKAKGPGLHEAITSRFDAKELKEGKAWAGRGEDFFFVTEAATEPRLLIDEKAGPEMHALPGSTLWYTAAKIQPVGALHSYHYVIDGKNFGGTLDLPVFGPLSYLLPGVPSGILSEKITHTSKIYDGMKAEYQIYVPAQYGAQTPAALFVIQDGRFYTDRNGNNPMLNVIDNLIAQKKIPVMICVFIDPGDIGGSPGTPTYNFVKAYSDKWQRDLKDSMRSTEYDTVSDRYPRYLRDEILTEVAAKYNLRKDAYSRAITGLSSGGICSFNAAWQMPEQFGRVISWIGSFESIQWKEDPANPNGGQDFPEMILREPKRNIRVWLEDGSNDLELRYGSWPMANLRMANALKQKEYDFHFSFGKGSHNSGQGAAEFPQEMIWLWRDYDPAKTEQTFEMEPAEKAKPLFRVAVVNRDAE